MASTQQLKQRITSVKNTTQITKAMELVAASKMRRAQENAVKSRAYRNMGLQILSRIRELTDVTKHPLYVTREIKTRLIILITSDRGLAGAYNSNLLRQFAKVMLEDRDAGVKTEVIVIGKKGSKFVTRFKDIEVVAAYHNFADDPTPNQIRPILNTIVERYRKAQVDAVEVLFTDYKSSLNQLVTKDCLLPAAYKTVNIPAGLKEAEFEPNVEAVLENVTERLIEAALSQAFLESLASEHSMRMMAMKSATDNANDLTEDLTLEYNTARQAAITQELAEITGGAEALK